MCLLTFLMLNSALLYVIFLNVAQITLYCCWLCYLENSIMSQNHSLNITKSFIICAKVWLILTSYNQLPWALHRVLYARGQQAGSQSSDQGYWLSQWPVLLATKCKQWPGAVGDSLVTVLWMPNVHASSTKQGCQLYTCGSTALRATSMLPYVSSNCPPPIYKFRIFCRCEMYLWKKCCFLPGRFLGNAKQTKYCEKTSSHEI